MDETSRRQAEALERNTTKNVSMNSYQGDHLMPTISNLTCGMAVLMRQEQTYKNGISIDERTRSERSTEDGYAYVTNTGTGRHSRR